VEEHSNCNLDSGRSTVDAAVARLLDEVRPGFVMPQSEDGIACFEVLHALVAARSLDRESHQRSMWHRASLSPALAGLSQHG